MPRLLVVEDEDSIAEPLLRVLERDGYDVERAADAAAAAALIRRDAFDIVLLDLGLPDLDGIELCREIRIVAPAVRVVMLTARSEEVDAVAGLDAGADDYIAKPFRVAELLARLRSQLRRQGDSVIESGQIRIDRAARRAWRGDEQLDLTVKEFDLLAVLFAHAGTVMTRRQLMLAVWDQDWDGPTKTLDIHVSSLRRKLGDVASESRLIATIRGVGYRLEVL